jgi:hypothetical protein
MPGGLALQQGDHLFGQGIIEIGRGLVGQQNQGAIDQGAGQGYTLLLPTRQGSGPARMQTLKTEFIQLRPSAINIRGDSGQSLSDEQILKHSDRTKQQGLLGHQPDVAGTDGIEGGSAVVLQGHQIVAVHARLLGIKGEQPGQGGQQCGLAAARGAANDRLLTWGEFEIRKTKISGSPAPDSQPDPPQAAEPGFTHARSVA